MDINTETVGVGMVKFGEIATKGLYSGFVFIFSSTRPLTLAQCQPTRTLLCLSGIRQNCIEIGKIAFRGILGSTTSSVSMAHSRWRSIVVKECAILVCIFA